MSCFLGLLIAFFLLEHDPSVVAIIDRQLSQWASSFCSAHMHIKDARIKCLQGLRIQIGSISCADDAGHWQWHIKNFSCSIAWWESIKHKKLCLNLEIDNSTFFSDYHDNQLSIIDHVKVLLQPTNFCIPFEIKRILIRDGSGELAHPQGRFQWNMTADIHYQEEQWSARMRLYQGVLSYGTDKLITALDTIVHIRACDNDLQIATQSFSACIHKPYLLPIIGDAHYHNGTWNYHIYKSDSSSLCAGAGDMRQFEITGRVPLYAEKTVSFDLKKEEDTLVSHVHIDHYEIASVTHQDQTTIQATIQDDQICLIIPHDAQPIQLTLQQGQQGQESVIEAVINKNGTFRGTIQHGWYSKFLKEFEKYIAYSPHAYTDITGEFKEGKIYFSASSNDMFLQTPAYYNFIKDFTCQGEIDLSKQNIKLSDLQCSLHKGILLSTTAHIYFEYDHGIALTALSMPFLVQDCFISHAQDLFAQVSGAGHITYTKQQGACIQGKLLIDRCYIQEEFMNHHQGMQEKVTTAPWNIPVEIQVDITAREPLALKTSLFELHVLPKLHISGTLPDILISGLIECKKGIFTFPYKPLFVRTGKIMFDVDSRCAHLAITAKNIIKKHTITMNIFGDIADPQIEFFATPYLTYEQIITLLFGGSTDGTLYLALPHTLHEFLQDKALFADGYLASLLRPLRSVRLVPSVSDQKGRGGLRASLIIEVADHMRALVQQNFSLTEDTHWEVEYDLSDDASIKAIKDEHGDLGAQFEMRWKF